jgi:3-methylcrotonyl-CoA carboxylase alpha subunit
MTTMFNKILIANRGEIACRVIATARRMGIRTVAVYSEADAQARHVQMADEAFAIGPAPARQSYLRGDAILAAAHQAGAQAIHPGYGFLSENAEFAEACAAAGIVFIGPPVAAIRAMGSKSAAKALMEKSGVPLVPGYHGDDQSLEILHAASERIGYPVLLKASAGGGGKGMRVVEASADFAEALARARGEARASFGDDRMLVEKYLTRPRHIEVQVFGDHHGSIISLFERDCSIQRRHQKVIEESPAPGITAQQRAALGEAAVAAARSVGYVGAGTVEFIFEDNQFYFMEMNTRLQVEHPVTEFVTGLDLVEWQLRVAAGEPLPLTADAVAMRGHSIEARICAEDPEQDFRPATGLISFLRQPRENAQVRVDTGIRQGDRITANYDSMIAKLIVWGADRPAALRNLAGALAAYELVGVRTNLDLLRAIVADADFAAGGIDTGFLPRHPHLLQVDPDPTLDSAIWAAAVLSVLGNALPPVAGDPFSPWGLSDGWRLNGDATGHVDLRRGEADPRSIRAHRSGPGWLLDLPGGKLLARLDRSDVQDRLILTAGDLTFPVRVVRDGASLTVIHNGRNHAFTIIDPLAPPGESDTSDTQLIAPTPARVVAVFVRPGDVVTKGQKLLILEAMKVETSFAAPRDGTVENVNVVQDELVADGATLVTFAAAPA